MAATVCCGDPARVQVIFYHGNCPDGAFAAAILHRASAMPGCVAVPAWWDALPAQDIAGKHVVFVDLTPAPHILTAVCAAARSVVVLDHHVTAEVVLNATASTVGNVLQFVFDATECGSTLAWQWVAQAASASSATGSGTGVETPPSPPALPYIKALDLFDWRAFGTPPEQEQAFRVSRALEQLVSPTVTAMTALLTGGDEALADLVAKAPIVDRVVEQQVDRAASAVEYYRLRSDPRVRVAVVNCSLLCSYVGHRLNTRHGAPLAMMWFRHGSTGATRVMMRSQGAFDCAAYALLCGGGGHANAASFTVKPPHALTDHLLLS